MPTTRSTRPSAALRIVLPAPKVVMLRQVLLEHDLVGPIGQPPLAHEQLVEPRLAGVGQREQAQLHALAADVDGHRGDGAPLDGADVRQAGRLRQLLGPGRGHVYVQLAERQAGPRIGIAVAQVEIRARRRDEQQHAERRHREDRDRLSLLQPELTQELASEQHGRLQFRRSSETILPSRSRMTRSA